MAPMIEFQCGCGAPMQVPPELAGRQGRCPRCGQKVQVPLAEEVVGPDDSGVTELGPSAAQAPARRSCQVCGKKLEPESVICTGCGTNQQTGEKLAGGARSLLSEEERVAHREQEVQIGFRELVTGVLLHPWSTLETISFQLSFPDTMARMAWLWLASLIGIGVLGGLQEQQQSTRTSPGSLASGTSRRFKTKIEGAEIYVELSPAEPVAGETYKVERAFSNVTLPGKMTYGLAPRGEQPERRFEFDRPYSSKRPPIAPSTSAGTLEVRYHSSGGKEIVRQFDVPMVGPISSGISVKALALGALRSIVISTAVLLGWTVLLAIGGRLMTGTFLFAPLLAVLAFLQGVANLACLPVLPFVPWIGTSIYMLAYIWLMWTALLYFFAVMNLYELDPRGAGLVVFFAVGALYVAWFFYNKAGMNW